MHLDLQQSMRKFADAQAVDLREASRFTPVDFRLGVQWLVTQNNMDLAQALAEAGLALYPKSEDILAISALLAEIQQDWTTAEDMLRKLVETQGDAATPFTWRHLIRVLRCQCEPGKAMLAAQQALAQHPQDDLLREELLSLQDLVSDQLPVEASRQMH